MADAAERICAHCGKAVAPDRERFCDHCGLPFAGDEPLMAPQSADRDAAPASGAVSNAMYPFELAKLELARTGKRRVFVCGRCQKGISLAWTQCGHCQATFDEFPPVDTGQVVQSESSRLNTFFTVLAVVLVIWVGLAVVAVTAWALLGGD